MADDSDAVNGADTDSGLLESDESLDDAGVEDVLDEGYSPPERPWAVSERGLAAHEATGHQSLADRHRFPYAVAVGIDGGPASAGETAVHMMAGGLEAQQMAQVAGSGSGRLRGNVALLAGATSGIGRTTAEMFAAEGAYVMVGGRRRPEGEAVAEAINSRGGRAVYEHLDVTDEASVESAVRSTIGEFGRLDILVSNAGGSSAADGPVTTASITEFWQKIKVDLFRCFLCSRFAIPEMVKSGGGSVVNIASLAGFGTSPGRDAYSSAKGGVMTLTRSTARQYVADGIRVNAIAPATVRTDRIETVPEVRSTLRRPRLGLIQPSEIAYAATFLASDEARSLTGQVMAINGGLFE